MANVTTRQLAELLVGIARAQYAVVEAIESSRAGFKMSHATPAITNAARVRDTRRPPTLADLPSRVLLQCQSRVGPDVEAVMRDLERMLAESPPPAADAPDAGGDSLDMT